MLTDRIAKYKKIEALQSRPLLVYATSRRPGCFARMEADCVPEIARQLRELPPCGSVDLLISSGGGSPEVAEHIAGLIREFVPTFSVLVADRAGSDATVLAMAADSLIMGHEANLGPIDVQCLPHGIEPIRALVRFLHKTGVPRHDFAGFLSKLSQLSDNSDLANMLRMEIGVHRWLLAQLSPRLGKRRAKRVIRAFTEGHASHSSPLYRQTVRSLGLPVEDAAPELDALLTAVSDDMAVDFQHREGFVPLGVTFADPQSTRIAAPLNIPVSRPRPIETVDAVVESARHASAKRVQQMVYVEAAPDAQRAKPAMLRQWWEDVTYPGHECRG